jgi:hypothetical protein
MCLVSSCFTGSHAMFIAHKLSEKRKVGIVTDTPKSCNNQRNQVTFVIKLAIALNSASSLKRETTVYFIVFHAVREPP